MMKSILLLLAPSLLYGQVVDIDPSEEIVVPTLQRTFQFTCTSDPIIESIQWRRNGVLIDDMEVGVNITFDTHFHIGILVLINLPVNCTTFQCVVKFDSGESITSVEVPLCVQDATPSEATCTPLEATSPEGTPEVTSPEGTPEGTPEVTSPEGTPEGTPEVTYPEGTPEVTSPEGTPEVTSPEGTPEGTPEVTSPEGTPEVTSPEGTPEVTSPEGTPEVTSPEGTAIRSLIFEVTALVIIGLISIAAIIYRWKHGSCCKDSSDVQVEDSSSTDSLPVESPTHVDILSQTSNERNIAATVFETPTLNNGGSGLFPSQAGERLAVVIDPPNDNIFQPEGSIASERLAVVIDPPDDNISQPEGSIASGQTEHSAVVIDPLDDIGQPEGSIASGQTEHLAVVIDPLDDSITQPEGSGQTEHMAVSIGNADGSAQAERSIATYDDAEESLNDSQSPLLNDYQVPLKTSAAETNQPGNGQFIFPSTRQLPYTEIEKNVNLLASCVGSK